MMDLNRDEGWHSTALLMQVFAALLSQSTVHVGSIRVQYNVYKPLVFEQFGWIYLEAGVSSTHKACNLSAFLNQQTFPFYKMLKQKMKFTPLSLSVTIYL